MSESGDKFDFDEWRKLAETDPQAFEARRRQEIDRLIGGANEQVRPRLEGLQWKVDMVRERSKNPGASCAQVFSMMWESVYGKDGLLTALDMDSEHYMQKKAALRKTNARVVKFARKDKKNQTVEV